jgi:hypothetical protein
MIDKNLEVIWDKKTYEWVVVDPHTKAPENIEIERRSGTAWMFDDDKRIFIPMTEWEKTMKEYKTCPDCGANLDPGETCDCKKEKKEPVKFSLIVQGTMNEDESDASFVIGKPVGGAKLQVLNKFEGDKALWVLMLLTQGATFVYADNAIFSVQIKNNEKETTENESK